MEVYSYSKSKNTISLSSSINIGKNTKWIRIKSLNEKNLKFLTEKFKLDEKDINDFFKHEERARITKFKEYIEIIFDAPVTEKKEIVPRPVYFIIVKGILISIENKKFAFLKTFADDFKKNKKKFAIKRGPFYLLNKMMDQINDDYLQKVVNISEISEIIEKKTEREDKTEDLNKLYDSNIMLTHFNQALIGNHEVLNTLRKLHTTGMNEEMREHFADLYHDCLQTLESLKIQREVVSNLFNFLSVLSTNRMNLLIKKLTSIALIFMIPTLIASAYGMNVSLPFQNDPNAFWYIVGASTILTIASFTIFKILDWI